MSYKFFGALIFALTLSEISPTRAETKETNFGQHHTYLINGLASNIPSVGYGLSKLQEKLGGHYYPYFSPVEGSLVVQNKILVDIYQRYSTDSSIRINLIGVSYGGNFASYIASHLKLKNIPVNYLGVIDSPAPTPIYENVHRVDNFLCRKIGCIGQRIQLTSKNKSTIKTEFLVPSAHIELSANPSVQARIIGQLTELPLQIIQPIGTNPMAYQENDINGQ